MPNWVDEFTKRAEGVLHETPIALEYLASRGVTPDLIQQHRLGYVSGSYNALGSPSQFSTWADLHLLNKIVFPLVAPNMEFVGLQVRSPGPTLGTKYATYTCYPQELVPYVFGLLTSMQGIYDRSHMVVVEGVFDYFAVRRYHPACVAILTAGISSSVKKFINRFATSVTMLTDMDEAGRVSISRMVMQFPRTAIFSPTYSEKDPGLLWEKSKFEELQRVSNIGSNWNQAPIV